MWRATPLLLLPQLLPLLSLLLLLLLRLLLRLLLLGPELGLGVRVARGHGAGIGGVTGSLEPSSRRKKECFLCCVRSL